MTLNITPYSIDLGCNAKAYIGTSANGGSVSECSSLTGVQISASGESIDTSTRANQGWKTSVRGMKTCQVTTDIISDSTSQNIIQILENAYLSNTSSGSFVYAAFLNKAGGRGPCGVWSVTNFQRNEDLNDAVKYNVTFELSRYLGYSIAEAELTIVS